MTATYGPQVTFDLPSGADGAQQIAEELGVDVGESVTWGKQSGEASQAVRAAIKRALGDVYGYEPDTWQLLPRKVTRTEARVEVRMAPVDSQYEDEPMPVGVLPDEKPRHAVLAAIGQLHKRGQPAVSAEDLEERLGDSLAGPQIDEALDSLEQMGSIYQREPGKWRRTDISTR